MNSNVEQPVGDLRLIRLGEVLVRRNFEAD